MQIQAVAFDMDGLLFDTERLALDAWVWAGEQIGLPIQRGIVMLTLGLDRYDTRRVFEEHYGKQDNYDHIRDLRVQYTKRVIERDGMPIRPGLMPLLDVLDARGIRYALATSTDRERAFYYLDQAGLSERFRYRVCGDMVRAGKPEPDIYSMAAQIMEVWLLIWGFGLCGGVMALCGVSFLTALFAQCRMGGWYCLRRTVLISVSSSVGSPRSR